MSVTMVQSRAGGVSSFLPKKSLGTALPSKQVAVQALLDFSSPSRAPQPETRTHQVSDASATVHPGPVQKPKPKPSPSDCAGAAAADKDQDKAKSASPAQSRWSELSARLADKDSTQQRTAKMWLKMATELMNRITNAMRAKAEISAARATQCKLSGTRAPPVCAVKGSWDDWQIHEMCFSHRNQCYCFTAELEGEGPASFEILASQERLSDSFHQVHRLGGDQPLPHESCDDQSHLYFDVRVHVDGDGQPLRIETQRIGTFPRSPSRKFWIAGTWDAWLPHEMVWDPSRYCFSFEGQLGTTAQESFQLLVNGQRHLAWYPDVRKASCHSNHKTYGPDGDAHGRAWSIGAHPLDTWASPGACFEVRVRLRPDGTPLDINWLPTNTDAESEAESQPQCQSEEPHALAAAQSYLMRLASVPSRHACSSAAEPRPVGHKATDAASRSAVEAAIEAALQPRPPQRGPAPATAFGRCKHCRRPMLSKGYASPGSGSGLLHAECLAQLLLEDLRRQERKRLDRDTALKRSERLAHDIGWKAARLPSAMSVLESLGIAGQLPQGRTMSMCCLVLDPEANGLRIAPTQEPAAAVNLGLLAVALAVRLREGREPFFSLDPIKTAASLPYPEHKMQVKRFEPPWLAGTSVGEVMFQADYHLKELSMGEHAQPVLGMRSCRDLASLDEGSRHWSGREWFVIRKAEVQISDDNVLVPEVRMGVEARAQVAGEFGLQDAKITQPDHPLLQYAEQFTENFDLIAERKSVIFHLRELARATVLAKFLIDSQVSLHAGWFVLPQGELNPCIMQLPQLWNECVYSRITVENGKVSTLEDGIDARLHGVYGGVDFGLDRMAMARGVPLLPAAPRAEALMVSKGPLPSAFSMIGGGLPAGRAAMAPTLRAAIAPTVRAQGVDLALDKIDLASPTRFPGKLASDVESSSSWAAPGDSFWELLHQESEAECSLPKEWKDLFNAVFDPALSDRRQDGERFIPPKTCDSYLSSLQSAITREGDLRHQRRSLFLGAHFTLDSAGDSFPPTWKPSIESVHRHPAGLPPRELLHCNLEPERLLELQSRLQSTPSALLFENTAEDGCIFRIYRLGQLEVRTLQAMEEEEAVEAVYLAQEGARD